MKRKWGVNKGQESPKYQLASMDSLQKPDPNEHPFFVSNMDRGCLQEHFHLKQCRTTLKDDWARAQISIGLQKQPPVSSSAIFESCPTLFWVKMLLRSSPNHIWRENGGFIRVTFFWRLSLEANWYLVSSSVIFEYKHGVLGLKLLPKPSPIHIWNENGGLIRVRYLPNINWPPRTASSV